MFTSIKSDSREKHSFLYSIVILIFQNFGVSMKRNKNVRNLKKKPETKYLYTDKTLDFL